VVCVRVYLGLVLLLVAGAGAVLGLRQRLWFRVLRRAEVTTPDELIDAARTGRLERRVRAVVGVADAVGPPAVSTVNGEPCVWHRHAVRHRQTRVRTDKRGRSRRSTRVKRVADVSSTSTFALAGAAARIDVLPASMFVHRPERRANRILPGLASAPIPAAAELFSGAAVRNTYHHREWIIRAGTPLYVLGEVAGRAGRVAVRRPAKGLHLISTRSAATLIRRARVLMLAGFGAAGTALVTGVALILIALL
jgi:E3 Ubiquitin ligase